MAPRIAWGCGAYALQGSQSQDRMEPQDRREARAAYGRRDRRCPGPGTRTAGPTRQIRTARRTRTAPAWTARARDRTGPGPHGAGRGRPDRAGRAPGPGRQEVRDRTRLRAAGMQGPTGRPDTERPRAQRRDHTERPVRREPGPRDLGAGPGTARSTQGRGAPRAGGPGPPRAPGAGDPGRGTRAPGARVGGDPGWRRTRLAGTAAPGHGASGTAGGDCGRGARRRRKRPVR